MTEKKIGWYGGTFNPIHFGHIHLAIELQERFALDEVLFSPAYVSPAKQHHHETLEVHHRLEMTRRALEGVPHCRVWEWEALRPCVSYAVDAVKQLEQEFGEKTKIFLIMGADSAKDLHLWKDFPVLVEKCRFLIGSRQGFAPTLSGTSEAIQEVVQKSLIPLPLMDITATRVRSRLKQGLYCGHLVPTKVLDYIRQEGIY